MIEHDNIVEKFINDPNKTPFIGVVGQSPLRDLIGFHSTTSLLGDIMHDFMEGICPMIIISLLKQASTLRLLAYSENDLFLLT